MKFPRETLKYEEQLQLDGEEWIAIDEHYQVSNLGRVKSNKVHNRDRIMRGNINIFNSVSSHLVCFTFDEGDTKIKQKTLTSYLVLRYVLGYTKENIESSGIIYKDGDRLNCRYDNLELGNGSIPVICESLDYERMKFYENRPKKLYNGDDIDMNAMRVKLNDEKEESINYLAYVYICSIMLDAEEMMAMFRFYKDTKLFKTYKGDWVEITKRINKVIEKNNFKKRV